jgi:hypothetical protein
MGARVIDGRGLATELKEKLAAEVAGLRDAGVMPGIASVLVGSPAEAARHSLGTADRGDIVSTCTISVESVSGERII